MTRSGRHRLCADLDVERLLEGGQYGGEVVHGGVAAGRKHSMQAFGWFVYLVGQGFEADGGVDEVAQQALGGFGLAIEKEVDRCQRRLKTDPGCRSKTDPPGHAIERVTSPQSGGLSLLAGHLSGTHLVA